MKSSIQIRLAAFRKALSRPVFGAAKGTKRHSRERGVALIMVVTTIAVLTAVAVDFQYNSSVDLQLAANARDELRAEYLARSAINMSRLLLRFQKQLDGQAQNLGPLMAQMGMPGGGAGLNIRLWDVVPIDCSLFTMVLGGMATSSKDSKSDAPAFGDTGGVKFGGALPGKGEKGAVENFGDFEGCFHAELGDEEQKVNIAKLNNGAISGQAAMKQALLLVANPKFDWIFEKSDANGVKMTAQETLIALHDWIDERDSQATLNITGTGDPFPDGFGDENRNYSRYPHRYKAKNAAFDSLDELYQVDGVTDKFMAAFRDRVTVYVDKNEKININTTDPIQQYVNIASVAANENDPKLQNPLVIQSILQEISYAKMFMPFMGMSVMQFIGIVEKNGVIIKPEIKTAGANNAYVTDKSKTFSIKATGSAGRVEKTITAVVRSNEGLGKVLYYREE